MDLRVRDRLYTVHMDLWGKAKEVGFIGDDIVIWDRQAEYSNLRPLGYPTTFRINRVHEYVLLLRKPKERP